MYVHSLLYLVNVTTLVFGVLASRYIHQPFYPICRTENNKTDLSSYSKSRSHLNLLHVEPVVVLGWVF